MPFRSKAQRRYMHAFLPELAQEWERYPSQKNLPEKVKKKKKSKMRNRRKTKRT